MVRGSSEFSSLNFGLRVDNHPSRTGPENLVIASPKAHRL